jgi:aspartyl-tRNA(Asn)/glutamyl-tRNA(Gln) amidotransferase subunit A
MYLFDVMTVGVNLAGLPALSIPCGRNAAGLPVGLQLIGPQLSDAKLLRIARAFEMETGFSNMIAPTPGGLDE